MVSLVCAYCGKMFERNYVERSVTSNHFCDGYCKAMFQVGKKHPVQIVTCCGCGKEIRLTVYHGYIDTSIRSYKCYQCEKKIKQSKIISEKIRRGFCLLFFQKPTTMFEKDRKIIGKQKTILPDIKKGSCCTVLKSHHEVLKDDPERLTTDFIKKLSQCDCDDI